MRKKVLDIDQANKVIKNETQVYEKFTKIFTKIQEAEEKTSKLRKELFQNFEDMVKITENDNETLHDLYKNFGKEMKQIEEYREEHLKTLKDIIIPVTQIYPSKLKANKANLDEITKAQKNTENLKKSVASTTQINKSINNEKEKINTFEKEFQKYEKERTEDNKQIFLKFIHSELKYHCAALQQKSELFTKTNKKNVLVGLKKFAKEYNLEKYNFKKLGIDMKELENEIVEEKNEENEKRSEVFDEIKKSKSENDQDENGSDDESSSENKKKLKKTKNSQIGKSQASELDNKRKSRNIEEDV